MPVYKQNKTKRGHALVGLLFLNMHLLNFEDLYHINLFPSHLCIYLIQQHLKGRKALETFAFDDRSLSQKCPECVESCSRTAVPSPK